MSLLDDAERDDQAAPGRARLPRQRGSAKPGLTGLKQRGARNGGRDSQMPEAYKPSALLLPTFLVQARERRRLARSFIIGAIGVAGVVALASAGMVTLHLAADHQRSEAEQANTPLTQQVSQLASVGQFYAGFATREQAVEKQLVTDVQYAAVLNQINTVLPAGSQINSVTTVFGQTCDGPDPFAHSDGLGCVRLDVNAPDLAAAGQFSANVAGLPGDQSTVIYDAYITGNQQRDDQSGLPVLFSATVNFNSGALSHRFAGLLSNPDQAPATAQSPSTQQGANAPATGGTQP